MCTILQSLDTSFDNMFWRSEIRLANAKINDIFASCAQGASAG